MVWEAIEIYLESLKTHKEEIPVEEDVFYSQRRFVIKTIKQSLDL